MILNEYDSYIKQKELKNFQYLTIIIEKACSDLQSNLSYPIFRDWFTLFIEDSHPEEKDLMVLINLFFKSQYNCKIIDNDKKDKATMIFIDLLYETINLIKKTTLDNRNSNNSIFPEEIISIISEELWVKITYKYKLTKESDYDGELINEIFGLFQILNEKLVGYMNRYFEEFLESEIFRKKFSRNYMKKSCLINNFWFEKPKIKVDMQKNYSMKPSLQIQRDRFTTTNKPAIKESNGDIIMSNHLGRSMNLSLNDKL